MELVQEQIDLIAKIIRADRKYANNEDLFDDFMNEACKRSFSILNTVTDQVALEAYLRKIISTSIVVVLKDLGRVRRTKSGYVSVYNASINDTTPDNKYAGVQVNYDLIDVKQNPEEIAIKKELLQKVFDSVVIAHSADVSKQFLTLFELRYVKKLKQKDIAKELNLSQSEVSKRLFELMDFVKNALE